MSDPYLGQIMMAGFNFAPRGYALCNGQTLPLQQNVALFSLLGTTYGGNGTTTFMLPNLQGRTPVGQGALQGGSTYPIGQAAGAENVALTAAQIPQHNHMVMATTQAAKAKSPANAFFANNPTELLYGTPTSAQVPLASNTIGNNGLSQSHPNMQPFRTISFAIALQGIFPSRT
ncbi:tail fiber protein [Luteibacter sp. PPL201]|uniref:Tail fiber protein n=1 Tax=Luteibacter sahnii TaxID=3021977 RepID=A0ABT6B859_9GAMM|nr:tail fiber protein [Luteibacter sp. PPL193]MDY1548302.1 tail fiber protein [Luteibacter sp. PPL193]